MPVPFTFLLSLITQDRTWYDVNLTISQRFLVIYRIANTVGSVDGVGGKTYVETTRGKVRD